MPPQSQFEVVRELIAASNQGREVVPLVGAGFSIESGIPALSSLTQYLAKVEHYIRNGLYNPKGHGETKADRRSFRKDPSRYLRNFGWPDPNQLDSDLWAHAAGEGESYRGTLRRLIQEELVEDIHRLDEDLAGTVKALREAQQTMASRRRKRRNRDLQPALDKLWSLKGNWKTLLAHLTHATPDYADTLFHQLVRHRQPGTSHQFLSLLAPILGIRLFLTTNFDNLLEAALRIEGHLPVVYEVSHDSPLPHPSLIRQELSVVKLHGGAFGLRVGESLDYPLDEESKTRLRSYLPDRPVLLVMGLGGWDRRITDLVELVVGEARERAREKSEEDTVVYWMHFEPSCPQPVQDLVDLYPGAISPVRIQDPGALLLELYSRITGAHPPASRPYNPHVLRPIDPGQPLAGTTPKTDDFPIQFFLDDRYDYGLGSSRALARLAARKAATHTPIWIDLEAMHTITDVVVEIFRQIRRYDPSLLPIVLPVGQALDDAAAFEKPIRRIYDALSRGQYLLAFNAASSFGRPPTSHHSTPAQSIDPDHQEKEDVRQQFLSALVRAAHQPGDWGREKPFPGGPLKNSLLAFSVDVERSGKLPAFYREVRSYRSKLVKTIRPGAEERVPRPADPGPELEALLLLATFRRRRSIVALRSLLPRFPESLPDGKHMDERIERFLDRLEKRHDLLRVEGGTYWMSRKIRDSIYASVQRGTRRDALQLELDAGRLPEPAVLDRIALLATVHDHIADYYLSSQYAASQDLQSLLEHIYHRASGLRYLTKLDRCLLLCAEGGCPEPVLAALRQRLDQIDPSENPSSDDTRVTRLRQSRLRSLLLVLDRERERLLSGVAADTLVDWVDWMQAQDIPRFRIDLCLDNSAKGQENARRAVFATELDRQWRPDREKWIVGYILRLWEQLDDLKASVLRDRLDVQACTELRSGQIHQLLAAAAPGSLPPSAGPAWLDENADAIVERTLHGGVPIPHRRKVVKYLCDIWAGRRGLREREGMKAVERMVHRIVVPHLSQIESSPDVCAMELRRLRYTADQLMALGSRKVRGHSLVRHRQVEERARKALEICKRGLQVVEWSAGPDYYRQRSYFHSLRGRAATLLGEFKTAHRELDLARSGLAPRTGADREMLAVNLLYVAECLLRRADHVLSEACQKRLEDEHRHRDDRETLSAEGRLCLLGDVKGWKGWEETLNGRSPEAQIELRGAMTLWLGFAAGEAAERQAWPREVYERRKSESGLAEPLDRWERLWPQEQIDRDLTDLRKRPAWPQDLADVQRLSLAHWAPVCVADTGKWGEELNVAIQRAGRRLVRAEEALDQAELTLADARRNVEWWIFLYELRAQLRVERLLLQSTEIHELSRKKEPGAWDEEKARFIARLISNLKGGLSAIRQGLDAMDAAGVPRQQNPRVRRLLRFWIELMICGGYLTREIESLTRLPGKDEAHLDKHKRLRWEILWERWVSHCSSAGFFKLLNSSDVFQKFDEATIDPNGYQGGPAGRAFILASVRKCLRSGGVGALLERPG